MNRVREHVESIAWLTVLGCSLIACAALAVLGLAAEIAAIVKERLCR